MRQVIASLFLLAVLGPLSSCISPPDYPDEPVIEYIRLNKTTVVQGNAVEDTLEVFFSFTDGDGDLSFPRGTLDSSDIFFRDSRNDFVYAQTLPEIPQENVANGISGEISVKVPNQFSIICCIPPNGAPPCTANDLFPTDTFFYYITIRDRAGNYSNEIQTDSIVVLCN